MSHCSLKRLLFVTLLAGGLALAGPAQVHAAPIGPAQGAWEWLTRIWREGVAVMWGGGEARSNYPEKAGPCIDPNGCASSSTSTPPSPSCRTQSEAGPCIDPNG
jgi:hypothetical protein